MGILDTNRKSVFDYSSPRWCNSLVHRSKYKERKRSCIQWHHAGHCRTVFCHVSSCLHSELNYGPKRFVRLLQLSSRSCKRPFTTSCAHPVACKMTAITIETVTTAIPRRRLSSTNGPPQSSLIGLSVTIVSPCQ